MVSLAEEALLRPDIDLVAIASPNATHAPLAEAALRAGRHVVVDKPFTLSLVDARRLAELAAASGRVVAVFQNPRWDGDFLALRAVLASGQIGRLTWLESRFDRFRPQVQDRWRERADEGGGIWLDLGPHLVDQALQLFGLPARVGGRLRRQRDGAVADDGCEAWLDYANLQVSLSASMLVGGGLPRFAAHGTAGSWIRHGLDVQEDQLKAPLIPNPKLAQRKLFADDRKFHEMAENDFATNGNDGMAMLQNTRCSIGTEWRLGYNDMHGYESETHVGRYIGKMQWLRPVIGFDWRYRKMEKDAMGMVKGEKNLFGQTNTHDNRRQFSLGASCIYLTNAGDLTNRNLPRCEFKSTTNEREIFQFQKELEHHLW